MKQRKLFTVLYWIVVVGWLPLLFMLCFANTENLWIKISIVIGCFALCIFGSMGIVHIRTDFDKKVTEKQRELDDQYDLYVKARTALEKYIYEQEKIKQQ